MADDITTIRVDFVSESAAFRNTFGWYNSATGEGGILFAGVEAQGPHPTVIAEESYAEFAVPTADVNNIHFFLIPNGDGIHKNTDEELSGPIKVIQLANGSWAVATLDDDGNIETDRHGDPNLLFGKGANALFTETSKNAGGVDYASSTVGSIQTAGTLGGDVADGPTGLIAWEDLAASRRHNGTYSKPGDADYNDAVFKVSITNEAPVAVADTNAGDPVVESGVGPGNTPLAGDPSATGSVLTNDSDADSDTLTVAGVAVGAATGPISGNVGTMLTGTYGTLTLNANGTWSYALDNTDSDTNALAKDETASDIFTYTISDGHGGTATTTLTVDVVGTNDAPVIAGTTTGAVQEDLELTTSAQLTATDPDHDAQQTWTAEGGTPGHNADFRFELDNLRVVKNDVVIFNDTFDDGVPPPDGPNGPMTYGLGEGETMFEENGRVVLTDEGGIAGNAPGSGDPRINNSAVLRTNIDPGNLQQGLKIDDNFVVEGIFDLAVPDDNREAYGIRLRDRVVGGDGTPPDQEGDDVIELLVRKGADGDVRVELREKDFAANEVNSLQRLPFSPPPDADQILLRLAHDANDPGTIIASFDYLADGVVIGSQSFTDVGQIFGTETPGDTTDDENWTRAEFVAWSPEVTASTKEGTYGTLSIEQDGSWSYALDNTSTALQGLADGQTKMDTFQVTVTDEQGATDTETVSITVTGTNDAPMLISNASVTRDLVEDATSPDLTATGLTSFSDVDLLDTHTSSSPLMSAILSSGEAIPPELFSALEDAITVTLLDPSTGNGFGEYQWDFAVANDLLQFLDDGEVLTATYDIETTDDHGLAATQEITINIAGVDDTLNVVAAPAPDNPLLLL